MKKTPKPWLVCEKCKNTDKTIKTPGKYYIGTRVGMQCPDCNGKLCRKCCQSEHGTKFDWDKVAVD